MNEVESVNSLQLHYFFSDNSHSIDAVLRNECEKELLNLFRDISDTLALTIRLESEPAEEGGFIETWNFLGNNPIQITLIISIATIILSRFPVKNKELNELQLENLRLDNQIKKKELEKLNLEFLQNKTDLTEDKLKESVNLVVKNYKTSWRKSNFFKKLQNYSKVQSIEIQRIKDKIPVGPPRKISKSSFSNFILNSDDLPEINNREAIIDVISPAIKSGNFRWKGFYNKDIITFEMKHEAFKLLVLNGDVRFSNRFSIEVNMTQKRKIDQDGNIKVTNTIVHNVTASVEQGIRTLLNL